MKRILRVVFVKQEIIADKSAKGKWKIPLFPFKQEREKPDMDAGYETGRRRAAAHGLGSRNRRI